MSHRTPDELRAALRASETLTDAILHSATEFAIVATDGGGTITTWNTGAENIFGWPAAEALGRNAEMVFTPEDRANRVPAHEMRKAELEGHAADDRWHLRRDGTRFFAAGSMMPLRGAENVERGFLKILRDQTEAQLSATSRVASARSLDALVATQRAVDAAGGHLSAVKNAVAAGALEVMPKADGAVVEMRQGDEIVYRAAAGTSRVHVGLRSKVAESFSGRCLVEGRPLLCADVETDDRVDRAACRKLGIGSMLAIPVPHHGEYVGVLKLHATHAHTFNEADIPIAQLLVGTLISGLMSVAEAKAASALRTSEAQLRLAQEAGGVGTFVWDLEGGEVSTSETFRTLLGLPTLVVKASQLTDIIHVADRAAATAAATDAYHVNSLAYREFRIVRPDTGEVRWIARRGEMMRDENGRFVEGIGVIYDVTERRHTEETLRQLNATLEGRVEERTQALETAEEKLRHSQKMEALGQLTGGIAHDFNNMLTGVVGSLDMMQTRLAQGRTDDLHRFVSAALTSANRAAAMTHRLLTFARRQPLDPKATDVNSLIASMEDLLRRTSGPAISVELALSPNLWRTACDANQLENALLNLAINARDAMPDGGRLRVETSNTTAEAGSGQAEPGGKPRQCVSIAVSDTGSGMAAEVIARALDPFFTTKPLGQGTGLGLAMVQGFVEQAGGKVAIESEIGHGTSVKLYLPRLSDDGEGSEAGLDAEAQEAPVKSVLIVEDEAIVRMLVMEVLEELGCLGHEAGDGKLALDFIESANQVDLLVTDIGLPGINGYQLAERARQIRPGLKVLFITGYGEGAGQTSALEPDDQVMSKPFAMEALRDKIRSMLDRPSVTGKSQA